VLVSRTMAFLAPDAHHVSGLAITGLAEAPPTRVGPATLEAPRHNWSAKIRDPISVSRAIDPSQIIPVRDRQLKKLIAVPERVRLPLAPGPDHRINAFPVFLRDRCSAFHCRLEEAVFLAIHAIRQLRVRRLENIRTRGEVAQNRLRAGLSRSQEMRGAVEGIYFNLVASSAGLIANIVGTKNLLCLWRSALRVWVGF